MRVTKNRKKSEIMHCGVDSVTMELAPVCLTNVPNARVGKIENVNRLRRIYASMYMHIIEGGHLRGERLREGNIASRR